MRVLINASFPPVKNKKVEERTFKSHRYTACHRRNGQFSTLGEQEAHLKKGKKRKTATTPNLDHGSCTGSIERPGPAARQSWLSDTPALHAAVEPTHRTCTDLSRASSAHMRTEKHVRHVLAWHSSMCCCAGLFLVRKYKCSHQTELLRADSFSCSEPGQVQKKRNVERSHAVLGVGKPSLLASNGGLEREEPGISEQTALLRQKGTQGRRSDQAQPSRSSACFQRQEQRSERITRCLPTS